MKLNARIKINLLEGNIHNIRQDLLDNLKKTFSLEDSLFSLLKSDECFYQKPEPLRHPLVFYFGHTASFYINELFLGKYIPNRVSLKIESTHAVGVDEMSWGDLDDSHYDWSSVDELRAYRREVLDLLLNFVENINFILPINWSSPLWPIITGIEHHNIHIETSSVLIRQLSLNYIKQNACWAPCSDIGHAPINQMEIVTEGKISLGKSFESNSYGWDNEYGKHFSFVKSFKAAKYLTSNKEYLDFIDDKGYESSQYWCEEGAAWLAYKKVRIPIFWMKNNNQYYLRTLDREIPLPENWPVEINYLESKAFCNWKSI